jgi:hypothetical protein
MKDTTNAAGHLSGLPWEKLFPDILWIIFWIFILLFSKNFIKSAITTLLDRLKHGAGVKIGSFELEGLKVVQGGGIQKNHFKETSDKNGVRENERASIYSTHRGAMLVHKIYKSQKDGQLYDILIYLIPKKDCNIIQVTSVDYYFGKFWDNTIFTSTDRSNGFAIATSAYGPFLCTAKINFNDGNSETIYRFIDFEMGDVATVTNLPKNS